jgi:pimeloyl-ACP methyl ester carboxylesterase
MKKEKIYLLIHSPLVGRLTWTLVAEQMQQRGSRVIVPDLEDSSDSNEPFWKQHAESAAQALRDFPNEHPVILVAHSGAGPLLPSIAQLLAHPIAAYVFVDAGIPRDGASRLDLMKSEDPAWAEQFQQSLERGENFPNWNNDDLREIVPDAKLREQLVNEIHPRGLNFFLEPIPVFRGWPDAPCIYIRFSAPYAQPSKYAQQAGWTTYELEAGHFHMLVDAPAVSNMIVETADRLV